MIALTPIPFLFPFINTVFVGPLRITAFQVLVCIYWRKQQAAEQKEKMKNAANAQEDVSFFEIRTY